MNIARVSCFASAAWRPSVLSKCLPTLVVAALALAALPRARATQTITLTCDIDTYIQMGEAVDHQTETNPLHVRGGASQQRLTYLKFTVPFSATTSGGGTHDIAAGNLNSSSPYKILLQVFKNTTTPAAGVTPSCIISLHPVPNGWWQPTARTTANANFDGAHYGTVVPAPLSAAIASLNSFDGTLPTGQQYIEFDVTSYVTGPGDYSFCLQTTSTTDIGFRSKEGGVSPAKLQFTVGATLAEDRVYFRRYPNEVLDAGAAIVSRYIAFNSAATPTGDDDVNKVGYIDATKQPYNLKSGGNVSDATDNYYALQRAVNEARDARCAVYIPPGRYVINDQIQLIQGLVPYETTTPYSTYGERWDINDFPCVLIGYGNDPTQRSTLILQSGATGFGSTTTPKPMLYFWSRWNNYTGDNVNTPPTWNRLASHFDATLANIDLELNTATTGSLNSGAIGVDMGGAQGTSIHDVNVKATNAFAGFRALPGPGGLTHSVSVTDGLYGLYCVGDATSGPGQNIGADTAISTVVAASTFTNQTNNAVYWQGLQGLVLVGCDIVSPLTSTSTAPVWVNGINTANRLQGNITIVESRISRAGEGPLVKGNRSVYLRDVYGNLANPVVDVVNNTDSGRVPPAGYSTGWTWVQECWDGVIIDQNADSAPAAYVKTRIAGQADSQRGILKKQVTAADIPGDLLSRHVPTATPRWNQSGVINVKDAPYSAIGDSVATNGDGAAIQAALDDAGLLATEGTPTYVFIPRGDFYIEAQTGNTGLTIPNNVIVFGIDKSYSRLKAQPEIVGPLVTAGEGDARDRGARTMLADLMLLQKMGPSTFNDNSLLKWQVGRHSVVRNVNFDRRNNALSGSNTQPLVLITGNGGGRWYDFWNDSDAGQGSGYRHLKIDGTSEPLKFYMLNAETDTDLPQVEIVDAANVQIFQTKWEGAAKVNGVTKRINQPVLEVSNSTDISVFGFSGNAELDDDGSNPLNADDYVVKFNNGDRVLAAQNNFQKSTADVDHYGWFRDAGPTTITTPHNEQFVLFRRNNPRRFALIPSEGGNTDGWMLGPVAGPASSFGATGGGSLSLRVGDDGASTPKQYRSIVSFDVRQIPDGATIHSMKLRLRVGDVPANLAAINDVILEVRQNSTDAENIFSTSANLENADFAGPTSGANTVVNVATVSVTSVIPYQVLEITIPSSFYNYVKPTGVGRTRVQFRIKPSASPGSGTADILGFYAGDTNNVDYKPVLEIVYTP